MIIDRSPVTTLYTDIGRGHPNYLDSVLRYIRVNHPREYEQIRITSIFDNSSGLSLAAWKAVRRLYRYGSRGGLISHIYGRLRSSKSEFDPGSPVIRTLQRDLLQFLRGYGGICLVAHPLIANMLKSDHRVFYLHGEIAAPPECATRGVEKVFVPLPKTRRKMQSMGVDSDSIVETGLVLEPELALHLDETVNNRLGRLARNDEPLTIGFFISGAYPKAHSALMLAAAESCHRSGCRVRFFWGSDSQQIDKLLAKVRKFDQSVAVDFGDQELQHDRLTVIVTAQSREEETIRSLAYLPHLDIFCAAPHERVNWAVGAGLPMLAIAPPIGTFAPQNLDFVLKSGCGMMLSNRSQFDSLGDTITELRASGKLESMITKGRNIKRIDGARVIAENTIAAL